MTTQTPTRPEAARRPSLPMIIWLVVAALIVSAAFVSTARGGSGDEARSRLALVAPAAPGGGWDLVAREAQQALKADGVVNNVQVVNIPGAAGTIGLGQVADMAGQAGTMMVTGTVMVGGVIANNSHTTLADVTPIARLAEDFEVIVVPRGSPHTTLDQFVEAWRANPHGMPIGGGSKGGTDHLLAGMIAEDVGIDPSAVNYIAFSGGGEALNALLSNTVAAGISGYNDFADQIEAGNVRVLAIGTRERVDGFDIPSLGEQGIDVELTNWRGLVAPPGLTEEQRNVLIEIVTEMHNGAAWTDTLERNRWRDTFITGDEFGAFIDEEMARIGDIAQRLGIGG
ncbi:Bug family tripartite tricarboxylate transporter substrate binding protein [Millisia brevis]|uniref:Bug family tripartite tricarboxylate transporter substrate binding protein n=1 Tax=Millisia brevis TaxID=264148 RepID=UPI000A9B1E18|nr:tripartite tricarboxylate transporter substrate-binding protein [Millisia brevis]